MLQGASRVIAPPSEAMDDWQILVKVGAALGVSMDYASAADIRADIDRRHSDQPGFVGMPTLTFGRPVTARNWLGGSNPSERWKWDVMFQDLPPVKGSVDPSSLPTPVGTIPLREIQS